MSENNPMNDGFSLLTIFLNLLFTQEDDKIITQLLETIEDLMKQNPDLFRSDAAIKPEKTLMTPTPPRRNRVCLIYLLF